MKPRKSLKICWMPSIPIVVPGAGELYLPVDPHGGQRCFGSLLLPLTCGEITGLC